VALVELSISKRVAEVTLNRPEKLNALTVEMFTEFDKIMARCRDDPNVSCVLIAGAGKAFCVGYDILGPRWGSDSIYDDWARLTANTDRWLALWDFPKPIVTAVHGYCFTVALFFIFCTDVTVAADDLIISVARAPISGAGWMTPIATLAIGMKKARELTMTRGSQLTGKEAHAAGLVNYSVEASGVLERARELATAISRTPLDLLVLNKRAANRTMERLGYREALTGGIEFNTLSHFSRSASYIRAKVKELGIKGAIEWWDGGGTLDPAFAADEVPPATAAAS
jgi:enoyl-CoA hydratase